MNNTERNQVLQELSQQKQNLILQLEKINAQIEEINRNVATLLSIQQAEKSNDYFDANDLRNYDSHDGTRYEDIEEKYGYHK